MKPFDTVASRRINSRDALKYSGLAFANAAVNALEVCLTRPGTTEMPGKH